MASRIIGRAACPECGFEAAHVKESDRCVYRYCPACGINGPHARTAQQRENMTRGMRPVQPAPTPTPTEAKPEPAAAPAVPTPTEGSGTPMPPPPAPSRRRSSLFGL